MSAPVQEKMERSGARAWLPTVLTAVAAAVFVAEAIVFVLYGKTWYDEGGYLYESWLVTAKGWLPYRDFPTRVPPLIYIVYGLPQLWFGPSLLVGRIEAALLTACAMWLSCRVAQRLGGRWAPPLLILGFLLSWQTAWHYFSAVSMPVVGLWMAGAVYLLLGPGTARSGEGEAFPLWRLYGSLVCVALLALTRQDLVAIYGLIAVYALTRRASLRHKLGAVALAVLIVAAAFVPLAVAAPQQVSSALTMGITHAPFSPDTHPMQRRPTVSPGLVAWYTMMSSRDYFFALLLIAAGVGYFLGRGRQEGWISRLRHRPAYVLLAGLMVGNPLLRTTGAAVTGGAALYTQDWYVAIPLYTLAAAVMSRIIVASANPLRSALLAVSAFGLVMQVAIVGPPDNVDASDGGLVRSVRQGAEALKRHSSPEDRIVHLGELLVCLEAERVTFPPLTEPVAAFSLESEEKCRRSLAYNLDMLDRWLTSEADVVILSEAVRTKTLGHFWEQGGREMEELLERKLAEHYRLAETAPVSGYGALEIYVRAGDGGGGW